jgi:hypothetical protein
MTYYWVCTNSRATGVTSGTGTAYPSGAHEINTHILVRFVLLSLLKEPDYDYFAEITSS